MKKEKCEISSGTRRIARIVTDYDQQYNNSGNVKVYFSDNTTEIMDNSQFIELTRQELKKSEHLSLLSILFQYDYDEYASFRSFMDSSFSDIIHFKQPNLENERGETQ